MSIEKKIARLEEVSQQVLHFIRELKERESRLLQRVQALEEIMKQDVKVQKEVLQILKEIVTEVKDLEDELNGRKKS